MKKKILSLFSVIIMMFACVFVTACGDKYGDMKFKVSYAFSESASEWNDGTNGISLTYGNEGDEFVVPENGAGNLYVKVDVENVNTRDIDKITVNAVSQTNINFSRKTVSNGEIFCIPVEGIVNTSLNLFESNSGKKASIGLVIGKSLTNIVADTSINPGVMIGNVINLAKLDCITYEPVGETNQIGVTYAVDSIGSYSQSGYVANASVGSNKIASWVTLNENLLKINDSYSLTDSTYVVRIKATSIYNAEFVTYFDVYVVEKQLAVKPTLKYASNNTNVSNDEVVLTTSSSLQNNIYTSTILATELESNNLIYGSKKLTAVGPVEYVPKFSVKNNFGSWEEYDFENLENAGINGLYIDKVENGYKIGIVNCDVNENRVKVDYVLAGLDFSATNESPEYSKEFVVKKNMMPSLLSVNGKAENFSLDIFHNNNYAGLALNLNVFSYNITPTISIENSLNIDDLIFLDKNKKEIALNELNFADSSTVYVKFKQNSKHDSAKLTVKTLITPEKFDGKDVAPEYKSITITLNKKVTASSMGLFVDENATMPTATTQTYEGGLILDYVNGGNAYLKVEHEGTLDASTIRATLTDSANVLRFVEKSSALSTSATLDKFTSFNVGYTIFSIPITLVRPYVIDTDLGAKLTVEIDDKTIEISASSSIKTVRQLGDIENVVINKKSNVVSKYSQADNAFAISVEENGKFEIVENNNKNSIYGISFETAKGFDGTEDNLVTCVPNSVNEFMMTSGRTAGTQLIDVHITYYSDARGYISQISEKALTFQVAVYQAITSIVPTLVDGKNTLAYVNQYFDNSATGSFTFVSNAKNGDPSQTVDFYNLETKETIVVKDVAGLKLVCEDVASFSVTADIKQGSTDVLNNISGTVVVKLTDETTIDNYTVKLISTRFGENFESVMCSVPFSVVNVNKSTGLDLFGDDLIFRQETTPEVELSFIDGDTDEVEIGAEIKFGLKENNNDLEFAEISSANIGYFFEEIVTDENGEIELENGQAKIVHTTDFSLPDVSFENGNVVLKAYSYNKGGLYRLTLRTLDSYVGCKKEDNNECLGVGCPYCEYAVSRTLTVRITDGSEQFKYVINNETEFNKINNDLDANYIVAKDIEFTTEVTPIGENGNSVIHFNGTITGTFETVNAQGNLIPTTSTLTYKIGNNAISSSYGVVYGLFGIIGDTGVVKDLNIVVSAKGEYVNNIGMLAGVNKGEIINVNVAIKQSALSISDSITFGLVAINEGYITLNGAKVVCEETVTISSTSTGELNIGLIAGVNEGEIEGNYKGKDDLDTLTFDVISNLLVDDIREDDTGDPTIYTGAIAGSNEGTIKNVILGGQISAISDYDEEIYVGGVAGSASGNISTCIALALNVTSANYAAGAVANSTGVTINNFKFVPVTVKFTNIGNAELTGFVKGKTVGGVVANGTATISNSSVESFVDNVVLEGTTVYGIAPSGTISKSFIHANLSQTDNCVIGNNSYFIGNNIVAYNIGEGNTTVKIELDNNFATILTSEGIIEELTHSVTPITNFENVYVLDDSTYIAVDKLVDGVDKYYKFNTGTWEEYVKGNIVDYTSDDYKTIWALNSTYNVVEYKGVSLYFPYLIEKVEDAEDDKYKALMIELPKEIQVSVNEKYVEYIHSEKENVNKPFDGKVDEIVFVNLFVKNGEIDKSANKHKLFKNKDEGLLDLIVWPETATGAVAVEVVQDYYGFATIWNNEEIAFSGATNGKPIIVRIYSVFDQTKEVYVAFYTQTGLSKLILNSSTIRTTDDDNKYAIDAFSGTTSVVSITDENLFKNNLYDTILKNHQLTDNLWFKVDVDSDLEKQAIKVNANSGKLNNLSNLELSIDPDAEFTSGDSETIILTLYINKDYFGAGVLSGDKALAQVELVVYLYKSATDLINLGSATYEQESFETVELEVNLVTDKIDSGDKIDKEDTDLTVEQNKLNEVVIPNEYVVKDNNRDSIIIKIENHNDSTELDKLKERTGETFYADLFNYSAIAIPRGGSGEEIRSYDYKIQLSLKDEYKYRYIESPIVVKVIIMAESNRDLAVEMIVTFKPTTANELKINNFAMQNIQAINSSVNIFDASDKEDPIITPGGKGGLMLLQVLNHYSLIESAVLTSDTTTAISNGKTVALEYTQLVYNLKTEQYETLAMGNGYNYETHSLDLKLVSTYDGEGNYAFDGNIYVHVLLDKVVALETFINSTLVVKSNGKTLDESISLKTDYIPGAYLTYLGNKIETSDKTINLAQIGTSNNKFEIELYGYQFNENPQITISWTEGYTGGEQVSNYVLYTTSDAIYNPQRRSYVITVTFSVLNGIPSSFKFDCDLSIVSQHGTIIKLDKIDPLVINPVDYILRDGNGVYLEGVANNAKQIAIGGTTALELKFNTINNNVDNTKEIYAKLYKNLGKNIYNIADLFSYIDKSGQTIKLTGTHPEFDFAILNSEIITLTGISVFDANISFGIGYTYEDENKDGVYELVFYNNAEHMNLEYTFNFKVYSKGSIDEPTPISSAADMFNSDGTSALEEGIHYILMQDIEVENILPINDKIASFDGNNKVITIKSFNTTELVADNNTVHIGLFGKVGTYTQGETTEQTILKNIIVDYSKFDDNANSLSLNNVKENNIVFGGLVGTNNGGLIYNCDVMSLHSGTTITILPKESKDGSVNITAGGLVGVNSGNITNSRVGRASYDKVSISHSAGKLSTSTATIRAGKISFVVGNPTTAVETKNNFVSTVAGFVGTNDGLISTSYVVNTSVENNSTKAASSLTAGFVGTNNTTGNIYYSYVKAAEAKDNSTTNLTGNSIRNNGNGSVAGFVYLNKGNIHDAYANIVLETNSAYVSGFVYNNDKEASISNSYSACLMNPDVDNKSQEQTIGEQPFVGYDATSSVLSYGELENVYYLVNDKTAVYDEFNKSEAKGLSEENFVESSLLGFVFVLSSNLAERNQGIWSFTNSQGVSVALPELTNANIIATSIKYEVASEETGTHKYASPSSYEQGRAINPYTIGSVADYNDVFAKKDQISQTGYVRFVNNIDFSKDLSAIRTRIGYTLGDSNNMTSIEGNGMTIKGIYFDVKETVEESLGLFANIKNAYVKNLNLDFAGTPNQSSTITVKYSGGLAGRITDSVIININLNGQSTTLTGKNFVGGLAGLIEGESLIYGITSNLSVKASAENNSNLYVDETTYNSLGKSESYDKYMFGEGDDNGVSYAGGIVGVLDIKNRSSIIKDDYNFSFITVNGYEMQEKNDANIKAVYAGGVAGYVSNQVDALKIKYNVGTKDTIRGDYAAGGLFAVSMGKVTASQVTAPEQTQYGYDTSIGKYIIDLADGNIAAEDKVFDVKNSGNLTLLDSSNYVGGLVGISLASSINQSYSKASVKQGATIGGLVGLSITSAVAYSYAVPVVNIDTLQDLKENNSSVKINIGGLIGETYNYTNTTINSDYQKLLKMNKFKPNSELTNVTYTFSTVISTKGDFENIDAVDNLCTNGAVNGTIKNLNLGYSNVYEGVVKIGESTVIDSSLIGGECTVELKDLYDTSKTHQYVEFDKVFGTWSDMPYWSIDNTKYFPLLTGNDVVNFIQIKKASDFEILMAAPDKHYMVMNDIDMSGWSVGNYILDTELTGMLVGNVDKDGKYPRLYNLSITAPNGGTTGFLRASNKATIKGLNLEWLATGDSPAITGKFSTSTVSGFVCEAKDTQISNVNVEVVNTDPNSKNYNLYSGRASGFGGIVGTATNVIIENVVFIGDVSAEGITHYGGIVAYAQGSSLDQNGSAKMVVMNARVKSQTGNVVTLSTGNQAYFGGAIGKIDNASVSGLSVEKYSELNEKESYASTIQGSDIQAYIGGLVGYSSRTTIESSQVVANTKFEDVTLNGQATSIGGAVGLYSLSDDNANKFEKVHAKHDIDTTGITAGTILNIAGGVGSFDSATETTISQCLFAGSIVDAKTTEKSNEFIATVNAGGAVANNNSKLTMDNVMSTVDVTISGKMIRAGGLVAYSVAESLSITNCATAGKIVPIGICDTPTEADEIGSAIGGLVGYANKVDNISSAYSTTSIIANQITNDYIDKVNINALIGKAKTIATTKVGENEVVNIKNVFYSSDISLAPEDGGFGTNYTAEILWNNNIWHKQLNGEDPIWEDLENAPNHLPYLASLRTIMETFEIITLQSKSYDYVSGSSLNPIVSNGNTNASSDFTYYLLTKNPDNKYYDFTGTLNGVLVGADGDGICAITDKIGMFTMSDNSAISNIHLKYEASATLSITETQGTVVDINNGVVFNCSVESNRLKVNGTGGFGLIVGQNNGLVSHCYSSAEIEETNVNTALINVNKGKLVSSYFTGYINNEDWYTGDGNNNKLEQPDIIDSAGVVYNNDNGYVYNCYMAGVVTGVADGSNSFCATGELKGANNFVDSYANNEALDNIVTYQDGDKIIVALEGFATYGIMSLSGSDTNAFAGKWHSVTNGGNSSIEGAIIDTKVPNFGYNYNYPIYKFNKLNLNGNVDSKFKLYTGNGTKSEPYKNLDILKNDYENAIKVPHLGVLKAIQGLLGHTLNYVVIYDIQGNSHEAVGTMQNGELYGFEASTGFSGSFVTNRWLDYSTIEDGDDQVNDTCSISGFSTNGLFANIHNAEIGYINFSNFTAMDNSGAVGTNVTGDVTLSNIIYGTATQLSENNSASDLTAKTGETNYFGGLLGSVDSGKVTINNSNLNIRFKVDGNGEGTYAGLIAGQVSGIVEFGAGVTLQVGAVQFSTYSVGTFGGLVGKLSGTITGDNANTTVELAPSTATSFGGLVGVSNGGTVKNFEIKYMNAFQADVSNLGGIIGSTTGNTTTINNIVLNISSTVTGERGGDAVQNAAFFAKDGIGTVKTFGLISAILDADIVESNVKIVEQGSNSQSNIILYGAGTESEDSGYGVLVGRQNANIDIALQNKINVSLEVVGGQNVGGVSGYYNKGLVSVGYTPNTNTGSDSGSPDNGVATTSETITYDYGEVTVKGAKNVGGVFGYVEKREQPAGGVETASTETQPTDSENIGANNKGKFDFSRTKFAKVIGSGENIGGMFGNLARAWTGALINNNTISFEYGGFAKNIGGVIGNYTAGEDLVAYSIINSGEISHGIADNIFAVHIDVEESKGKYERVMHTYSQNVGGIIGYVENAAADKIVTLSNMTNGGEVQGYQNVGGIVGQIKGSVKLYSNVIANDPATTDEDESKVKAEGEVYGAINVGGAVGLISNAGTDNKLFGEITNIKVTASVHGNANVGGLVGASVGQEPVTNTDGTTYYSPILSGNTISNTTKAIYYQYAYDVGEGDGREIVLIDYIPTSVGGLVGNAVYTTNQNNNLTDVSIISSLEGQQEEGKKNYSVISTIKNYMFDVEETKTSSSETYILDKNEENRIKFGEVKSGFGGLAGTIDYDSMNSTIDNETTLTNLTINAPLGMNVGTYYGYYNVPYDTSSKTLLNGKYIVGQKLSGNASIDGAYFVGGIAGSVDAEQISNVTNADLISNSSVTVTMQTNVAGMYVGGLFGQLRSSNAMSLTVNGNIKIDTSKSFYMGGLVGRLVVNKAENIFTGNVGEVQADNSWTGITTSSIKSEEASKNFGGLVGMLKCINSYSDKSINVSGSHGYAFTVNTIENQNYADGSSNYKKKTSNSITNLYAEAYYINQDNFNISATQDSSWYNATAKNPTRSDSVGWAKEYTGFKALQRCVVQPEEDWDAIMNVYDADNITKVATGLTTGKTGASYRVDEDVNKDGQIDANDTKTITDQYIIYTIYDKANGDPLLYCPIGIAEIAYNEDGSMVSSVNELEENDKLKADMNQDYLGTKFDATRWSGTHVSVDCYGSEKYYRGKECDDFWKNDRCKYCKEDKGHGDFINLNTERLLYFDWSGNDVYRWYGKPDTDMTDFEWYGLTNLYYCIINDYQNIRGNKAWFKFSTVYGNSTTPDEYKDTDSGVYNPSPSGSVFVISGIQPKQETNTITYEEKQMPWWCWIIIAVVVVGIGVLCYFCPPVGAFFAKIGVTWFIGGLALIGSIVAIFVTAFMATFEAKNNFLKTTDQNYGLLGGTNIARIKYKNGVIDGEIGSIITIDEKFDVAKNGIKAYEQEVDGIDYNAEKFDGTKTDIKTQVGFEGDNYVLSLMYKFYSAEKPYDYSNGETFFTYVGSGNDNNTLKEYSTSTGLTDIGCINVKLYKDDKGHIAMAYRKYIYDEGVYYYLAQSSEVGYHKTNLTELSTVYEERESLSISANGAYYVYGELDGSEYKYVQENGNNLTYETVNNTNKYIDNTLLEGKDDDKNLFSGYTLNDIKISKAKVEGNIEKSVATKFVPYEGYNSRVGSYKSGYDYLTIYHTINGSLNRTGDLVKYATFTFVAEGDVKPNELEGEEGVHFIKREYKYDTGDLDGSGNVIYGTKSGWFKLQNSAFTTSGSETDLMNNVITMTKDVTTITVAVYPATFVNPYSSYGYDSITGEYYFNVEINNSLLNSINGIMHDVKYFLFEGGDSYKVANNSVYIKTYYKEYEKDANGANTTKYIIKDTADGNTIAYYNDDSDKYGLDTDVLTLEDNTTVTLADLFDGDDESDDKMWILDNNIVYLREPTYVVGDGENQEIPGAIYTSYLVHPNAKKETYIYNKYMHGENIEEGIKLYTAHMFTNKDDNRQDLTQVKWDAADENSTKNIIKINIGGVYYLVESAKVTIGGGLDLYMTIEGEKSDTPVKSGTISIE